MAFDDVLGETFQRNKYEEPQKERKKERNKESKQESEEREKPAEQTRRLLYCYRG